MYRNGWTQPATAGHGRWDACLASRDQAGVIVTYVFRTRGTRARARLALIRMYL